jgi:pimeloyl-ACP methyl ester carboxylesterase
MRLIAYSAAIGAFLITSAASFAQDAPTMISLPTGSELATWTIAAEKLVHKTPVIFVHGGPGMYTTDGARKKGASLRNAGFNTIYFDQAGGGKSKQIAVKDYTIERAVADLEALRVALGQDKVILWGSSYGASLAAIYTARYPGNVAGIILTSPGSFPGTSAKRDYKITNRDKVKMAKELTSAVGKVDKNGQAAEASLSQTDAGRLFDDLVNADLIGGMVCKGSNITPPPPGVGGNLYANRLISKDLDKLKFKFEGTIKVPAMVLRGSCDFVSESSAAKFAALFGTTVTTITGSGHGMLENRTDIEAAFSQFVNGPLAAVE